MNFDLSKENIQPLRGGRNPTQLGMALQAETNKELQMELEKQRKEFEDAIKNYIGDDPLENYYNYISWVEQSFPKHGHEGNLVALLEHCLTEFENDPRYTNNRKFCKLWIKYIDLQQNPLELYHMMHARDLCAGCSDLYRAWAYYHEAAWDFKNANKVLQLGKKANAQPYEELESAYQNLLLAVGQFNLHGPDAVRGGLVEKRQALTSLMTYQPGRVASVRVPSSNAAAGILPTTQQQHQQNRFNSTIQIFIDNRGAYGGYDVAPISIITAARKQEVPKENTMKPGPWSIVSAKKRAVAPATFVGFRVHEDDGDNSENFHQMIPRQCLEDYSDWKVSVALTEPVDPCIIPMYPKDRVYIDPNTEYSIEELRSHRYRNKKLNQSKFNNALQQQSQRSILAQSLVQNHSMNLYPPRFGGGHNETTLNTIDNPPQVMSTSSEMVHNSLGQNHSGFRPQDITVPEPSITSNKIAIYDESMLEIHSQDMQPKGSAMKTPFKTLNPDELVETGSRGGMDVAATVQPADSAQSMPIFKDENSSSVENLWSANNLDDTQIFNLNLIHVSTPEMKKPCEIKHDINNVAAKQLQFNDVLMKEGVKLSVIMEETKGCGTHSSGSQTKDTTAEDHKGYLMENLQANAALRMSLGSLFNSGASSSTSKADLSSSTVSIPIKQVTNFMRKPMECAPENPFDKSLINHLLERVGFPGIHNEGYIRLSQIPRICVKKEPVYIGNTHYIVEKQLGKGAYGTVFMALNLTNNQNVALKSQRPANKWEFYICREIQARLKTEDLKMLFMSTPIGYFSLHTSLLVSEYKPCGSLLDLANNSKQKLGLPLKEPLCIYFTLEMLNIVLTLHDIKIIHADVKPDNFLVYIRPDNMVGLQLIDFGCSIDMTLFPPNTTFKHQITTENFVCCEMRDGKPWNYHTDLFCVAASAHVLLFDKYITLQKTGETWSINTRLPRYIRIDLWNMVFSTLLNQSYSASEITMVKVFLQNALLNSHNFEYEMRYIVNMLKKR